MFNSCIKLVLNSSTSFLDFTVGVVKEFKFGLLNKSNETSYSTFWSINLTSPVSCFIPLYKFNLILIEIKFSLLTVKPAWSSAEYIATNSFSSTVIVLSLATFCTGTVSLIGFMIVAKSIVKFDQTKS